MTKRFRRWCYRRFGWFKTEFTLPPSRPRKPYVPPMPGDLVYWIQLPDGEVQCGDTYDRVIIRQNVVCNVRVVDTELIYDFGFPNCDVRQGIVFRKAKYAWQWVLDNTKYAKLDMTIISEAMRRVVQGDR